MEAGRLFGRALARNGKCHPGSGDTASDSQEFETIEIITFSASEKFPIRLELLSNAI